MHHREEQERIVLRQAGLVVGQIVPRAARYEHCQYTRHQEVDLHHVPPPALVHPIAVQQGAVLEQPVRHGAEREVFLIQSEIEIDRHIQRPQRRLEFSSFVPIARTSKM